jgi:hypothetical protein
VSQEPAKFEAPLTAEREPPTAAESEVEEENDP